MRNFIKIMKALSEPNRVKILKILQRRDLCVCEIRALLEIAQPLVSYRKDGLWADYRLAEGSTPYVAMILGRLRNRFDEIPEIAQLVRKASTVSRNELKETFGHRE